MSDENTKKPADEKAERRAGKLKLPEVGVRDVEEIPSNVLDKIDGGICVTASGTINITAKE